MDSLAKLENVQTRILQRIRELEFALSHQHLPILSHPHVQHQEPTSDTESRLSAILHAGGVKDFSFKRVPIDYYNRTLEYRREILGASTVDHLCKSIVLVNTQAHASVTDCSDPKNSKYYVVVIQYTARLNAENLKNFLYSLNNGKIPKKKFNMRLAPDEDSLKLTGFEHNAVTCIGMKTDIPNASAVRCLLPRLYMRGMRSSPDVRLIILGYKVILDEAIVRLEPNFFWLGGGEIDLKLGIRTSQFIDFVKPFIVNCSS